MNRIAAFGIALLVFTLEMQLASSVVTLRVPAQPESGCMLSMIISPTSSSQKPIQPKSIAVLNVPNQTSTSNPVSGGAWHSVESWTLGLVAVLTFRSQSLVLQREDKDNEVDLDEHDAKRLKSILERWLRKIERQLHCHRISPIFPL